MLLYCVSCVCGVIIHTRNSVGLVDWKVEVRTRNKIFSSFTRDTSTLSQVLSSNVHSMETSMLCYTTPDLYSFLFCFPPLRSPSNRFLLVKAFNNSRWNSLKLYLQLLLYHRQLPSLHQASNRDITVSGGINLWSGESTFKKRTHPKAPSKY